MLATESPSFPAPSCALSVVVPCHDEAASLPLLLPRLLAACRAAAGEDFEILLIDDGSADPTWAAIEKAAAAEKQVAGVALARRYGQQIALSAGLSLCRGARVFITDADLQDPPELLAGMMKAMDEGADVVYGQRRTRQGDGRFKRGSAALFYRLMQGIGDPAIPADTGDFRLINRRVWELLQQMPERQRYLRGMIAWLGLKQVPLLYDRAPRATGRSHYPFMRMLHFAMDGITGFSVAPLRLSLWLSFGCVGLALALLAYVLVSWLFLGTVRGWTSLTCIVLLFFGLQFFCIGMIGEYVGRIYMES
ncbi:MAG TPA: glycosyltransferase family 2 protein, partial [Alphaproteobacteria bacterium]|nr:glycosyltransferase family 2 protein [Alphaproteobacteria bacterium]